MTPLPSALGGIELVAWRVDQKKYASTWNSGEGTFLEGGRWNAKERRVLYCSLDPATALIEVAAHKGFNVLDMMPHVLTSLDILPTAHTSIHVVNKIDIPNENWMRPGAPSIGQQQFGEEQLNKYPIIVIPSVVSSYSWNLIIDVEAAKGLFKLRAQIALAIDTRLSPP